MDKKNLKWLIVNEKKDFLKRTARKGVEKSVE